MARNNFCAFLVLIIFGAGCQHVARESSSDPKAAIPHINRDTRIYVGTPANATYKKNEVLDSGRLMGEALKTAFGNVSRYVFIGRNNELLADALDRARATRSQYLIFPTILAWEDHPTEWNGIPDKIDIKLEIIDVATADILYTARIKARSRLLTDGGDRPEMLLHDPLEKFAESMLKSESIPSALR